MIGETETALLDVVKGLFGQTLRDIDTHPGTWDDVAIKRMLLSEPAVYLAWLGCGEGRTAREVESRWVFYVCASMLNGREGDRLGIYQIIERLVAGLNWKTFGPTSGFKLTKAQNLYTDAQGAAGCALYGLYFSGRTPIADGVDISTLDDYERHWQTWKQPEHTPPFEAHINVNERKP